MTQPHQIDREAVADELEWLSSLDAERMGDGARLTAFCHAGRKAVQALRAPAPMEAVALREKVARICGGSTVENMGTHPFEGDAADLDWSSWQFADAILALIASHPVQGPEA